MYYNDNNFTSSSIKSSGFCCIDSYFLSLLDTNSEGAKPFKIKKLFNFKSLKSGLQYTFCKYWHDLKTLKPLCKYSDSNFCFNF